MDRKLIIMLFLLLGGTALNHSSAQSFQGKIGKTLADSKAWSPEKKKAPQGAPNVVWILLDDVGFGAISSFGGLIETPTLDSLANNGLRYTNFHTTAICAPTRAALLTGRNHHSVGMGLFTETAIGFPGYHGRIAGEKGNIAEILKENGYNTFALGKWHLTPVDEVTQAGPYDRWPTGKGFEHYYGFLYGETDQWHPQVWEENQKIDIEPNTKHFNQLIADKAIQYIASQKSVSPEKPFFLYFAPGAAHAPHQVAKEWSDKYKGKFDKGWDKYREEVLARQAKLGIVPKNTTLPARHSSLKAWETLSPDQKKVYARFMEVYAGFLSYTDYEIGRVVNYIKSINQLDNTIVAVVVGDNGASKEGTDNGTVLGLSAVFQGKEDFDFLLKNLDKIGTEYSSPNYPLAWAQATNTPFKQWKQDANAEGGTRNPLILFYPKGIKEKGAIRAQYGHVIDLLPTTLELTGVKKPEVIKGYKQDPIEGTSLTYSIADAKALSKHTVQYYEINGTRAIYKDGWKAGTLHKSGTDFNLDKWELYNLNEDFNEQKDLAQKNPEKLKELLDLFDSEAKKYNVYPLKDNLFSSFGVEKGPYANLNKVELYPGTPQLFAQAAPNLKTKSFTVTAETEIPASGAEGVLLAEGGRFSGISLFVQEGKLHFVQTNGVTPIHLSSANKLSPGKAKLKLVYTQDEGKPAPGGTASLFINSQKEGEIHVATPLGILHLAYDEGFDIGKDSNTPVSESYKVPFAFNGKLEKVSIDFTPATLE